MHPAYAISMHVQDMDGLDLIPADPALAGL